MKKNLTIILISFLILPLSAFAAKKEGGTGKPEENPSHTKPNPIYTLLVDTKGDRSFDGSNTEIEVEAGRKVTYRLLIDNQGDGDFRNVQVRGDLAKNVDYYLDSAALNRNITNNVGRYTGDGRSDKKGDDSFTYNFNSNNEVVSIDLGTVKAGQKAYVEFAVFVPPNATIGTEDMTFQVSGTEVPTEKIKHTISTKSTPTPSKTNYYFILDFSFSMNEIPGEDRYKREPTQSQKRSVLIRSVQSAIQSLNSEQFAIRVYGSEMTKNVQSSCNDHKNILTFGQHSDQVVSNALNPLGSVGYTPIAGALEGARKYLNSTQNITGGNVINKIILISDGVESCGGNPIKAAMDLASSDLNVAIDTIGFDIDAAGATQLKGIAEATGGQYFSAG